ncbi:MAG: ABC transporter ATP-binding protein [Chloroflexi bacterium]|nr:ABC transporter ATP-binding protein [Chloroflexota bacterium]
MLLTIKDLSVFYGKIQALDNINIYVKEGEIISIIGANGAGKSTLLKAISGVRLPNISGDITYLGKKLTTPVHNRVKLGIALSPEGRRIFGNLTTEENLIMGAYLTNDRETFKNDLDSVFELFPRLKERRKQLAATLSGGEQQMLAIGRAMMSRPKLLMMDEPSLGLAPKLVTEIFIKFKQINESGVTILLVEQNANQALSLSHRAYVLQTGRIVGQGTGKELLSDPKIKEAYLGARKKSN